MPRTTVLRVDGMTCGGCVARVRTALLAVDGVDAADVTLEPPAATVTGAADGPALVAAVAAVGKRASPLEDVAVLRIDGMSCGGCVGSVRTALEAVGGVAEAAVTLEPPGATVRGRGLDGRLLVAAVAGAGKTAAVVETLRVEGMSCQGCVGSVREALEAVEGVVAAEVTLEPPLATVRTDGAAGGQVLVEAVSKAGKRAVVVAAAAAVEPVKQAVRV